MSTATYERFVDGSCAACMHVYALGWPMLGCHLHSLVGGLEAACKVGGRVAKVGATAEPSHAVEHLKSAAFGDPQPRVISGYLGVSRSISVDLASAAFGDPLARLHGDDRSETGCETEFYAHLRPRALELAPRAGAVAMWSECRVLARRGLKPARQGHESPCLGRRTRGLLSA